MNLLRNKGFTLIEVLIVIAIIGILAAIAIPQFSKYRMMSHNAAAMSDIKNAITAQEAYYAENRIYAGSFERLNQASQLFESPDVTLDITGDENGYTISSHHSHGDKTYLYTGPGGTIIKE